MDGVTGGPVETGTNLAAVKPISEGWASCKQRGGIRDIARGLQEKVSGSLDNLPESQGHLSAEQPPKGWSFRISWAKLCPRLDARKRPQGCPPHHEEPVLPQNPG